jgi:GNAT superfamily N-acetyltransferase
MEIRPYRPEDAPACLAIFDSNTPTFFLPSERNEFVTFLAEPDGTYLVGIADDVLVACGGYWPLPHAPVAALTWGMIHRDRHRQGLGRQLLEYRLAALRQHPGLIAAVLQTSQHSATFFTRAGFVVEEVRPDGYGPGLDEYRLRLPLS